MISAKGIDAAPLYRQWRDRFAEAIDGRFYGIEYLDYLILGCGMATIHVGEDAAIVTEFKHYPNCKAIHGLVAAGDLGEITATLIPAAEAWAKRQGCQFAVIESRPGWERQLKASGYEPFQHSVSKEL